MSDALGRLLLAHVPAMPTVVRPAANCGSREGACKLLTGEGASAKLLPLMGEEAVRASSQLQVQQPVPAAHRDKRHQCTGKAQSR